MPLPAPSPQSRARHLIAITARLSELMDQETALLKSRRAHAAKPLVEEKAKLSAVYAREIRAIARNRSLIDGLAPDLREELKAATRAFEEKTAAQKALIGRIRRVTEGVIKAIADEAAKKDAAQTGYGALGASVAPAQMGYAAPKPTTLSLNEVV